MTNQQVSQANQEAAKSVDKLSGELPKRTIEDGDNELIGNILGKSFIHNQQFKRRICND